MTQKLTSPSGQKSNLYSPYRAVIAAINDPKKRLRYRVRVWGVHPDEIPADHLPWAEVVCFFGGKLFGDFGHFEVGDRVIVMFEGGDHRLPLIVGSSLSESGGVNDVPVDMTTDYASDRRRWLRVDRVGNTLEFSELPGEMWARLASGAAEVVCDQRDGSVTLRARSGMVRTEAAGIEVEAKFYAVTGEQVIVSADAANLIGGPAGVLQLSSNLRTIIHALDPITGEGVVDIGGYTPRLKGVTMPAVLGAESKQTKLVNVRARTVKIGSKAAAIEGLVPVPETETVEVNGVEITIETLPAINKASAKTAKVTIRSAMDIVVTAVAGKVDVTAATEIKLTAPSIKLV